MPTPDWARTFDLDHVFWSPPERSGAERAPAVKGERGLGPGASQESVYDGLGRKIVEDALNVSEGTVRRDDMALGGMPPSEEL